MKRVQRSKIYVCKAYPTIHTGYVITDSAIAENLHNQGKIKRNGQHQFYADDMTRSALKSLVTPIKPKPIDRLTRGEFYALVSLLDFARENKNFYDTGSKMADDFKIMRSYVLRQRGV